MKPKGKNLCLLRGILFELCSGYRIQTLANLCKGTPSRTAPYPPLPSKNNKKKEESLKLSCPKEPEKNGEFGPGLMDLGNQKVNRWIQFPKSSAKRIGVCTSSKAQHRSRVQQLKCNNHWLRTKQNQQGPTNKSCEHQEPRDQKVE